jgi:hypothetical protein
MKIEVITSFNQHFYDVIGRDAVRSWLQHWPQTLRLTCYVEQCKIPANDRTPTVDFDRFDDRYWQFQQDPLLKSRVKIFAKKAWSFMHAAQNSTADRVIWIDADVITTQTMCLEFLQSIMPDSVLSTHLGVTYETDGRGRSGPWLVPETGFFAINRRHEKFQEFVDEYQRRYLHRDCADLRRFYDNDVYGAALTTVAATVLDLCAELKKSYKTPLRHTVLGSYLCHYKSKHNKAQYMNTLDAVHCPDINQNYLVLGHGRTGSLLIFDILKQLCPGHHSYFYAADKKIHDGKTDLPLADQCLESPWVMHSHEIKSYVGLTDQEKNNTVVIHSQRRNKFDCAVSHLTARHTGVFYQDEYRDSPDPGNAFDVRPDDFWDHIHFCQEWKKRFNRRVVKPDKYKKLVTIDFDELISSPATVVSGSLDLPMPVSLSKINWQSKKNEKSSRASHP